MIGLRLRVPLASWRKAHARELLETERIPSPATCYGALLSLVGETDRGRHIGARVTAGLFNQPAVSTVLRTLWRIKDPSQGLGNGSNARPDFQQLVIDSDVLIVCDSSGESDPSKGLEQRVIDAMTTPSRIERFGAWSLGESSHLVNDAWLVRAREFEEPCDLFVADRHGSVNLQVWVDHVGTRDTRYAVGRVERSGEMPDVVVVTVISPS